MEKRLIKDGDIILDGTLPRYQKEKNAFLKLQAHEDIEEELGVDLKLLGILAKALKQGYIYYPIDVPDDCYKYKVDCMYYNYGEYYLYVSDGVGDIFAKDYGKTWALTKEELE